MSLLPLLDLGTSGNDGTGDSLREGGQIINDKFTELYAATNELRSQRTFYVDGIMGDDATAAPFKTLSMALSAITGGGTADAPWTIILQGGDITEANAITMALPYVTIRGQGIKASRILFTGTAGLTISASNVCLSDLNIQRSGPGAAFLLHVATTSLATYKNCRLDRICVRNDAGVAIGTFSGDAYNIEAYGKIGFDWIYGGRVTASRIVAHDPLLGPPVNGVATSHAVKRIQPIAVGGANGGQPIYDANEFDIRQRAGIFSSYIINTNPDGVCVNGLGEDALGDNTTVDWHYNIAGPGDPGENGGQPYVSWYPPVLASCYLIGPNPQDAGSGGASGLNQGTIARTIGTGGILRGTLRILNCEVYGFNLTSYLHDSDTQGGMWVTENGRHRAMEMTQSCSWTGVSFIIGDSRDCYDEVGVRRITLETGCVFQNCHFQGETAFVFEGYQYMMDGCTEIGFRDSEYHVLGSPLLLLPGLKRGIAGWRSGEPLAIRLNGGLGSFLRTGDTITDTTLDYALATMTIEAWFRCDTSGADGKIWSYAESTNVSELSVDASDTANGRLYCYAGGALICNITSVNINDGEWHHAALVVTGGTGQVFVDGTSVGAPVATLGLGGTSGFRVGSNLSNGARFKGDICELAISKVARTITPTTIKLHLYPVMDNDLVSYWDYSTKKNLGWTDRMGLHDLNFYVDDTVISFAPDIPYWVRRDRSLEWLHATTP